MGCSWNARTAAWVAEAAGVMQGPNCVAIQLEEYHIRCAEGQTRLGGNRSSDRLGLQLG